MVMLRLRGIPECTACGLCCAPERWCSETEDGRQFVDLKPTDVSRLRRAERHTLLTPMDDRSNLPGGVKMKPVPFRSGRSMLMVLPEGARNGSCVALQDNRCSIYQRRPAACREWKRGGPRCRFVLWRSTLALADRLGAGRYPAWGHGRLERWSAVLWAGHPPWWRLSRWWAQRRSKHLAARPWWRVSFLKLEVEKP